VSHPLCLLIEDKEIAWCERLTTNLIRLKIKQYLPAKKKDKLITKLHGEHFLSKTEKYN
jgi:hypothetical protein